MSLSLLLSRLQRAAATLAGRRGWLLRALLGLLGVAAAVLGLRSAWAATWSLSETFKNTTASGWTLMSSATLTAASGPDSAGTGWLRLTPNTPAAVGGAWHSSTFTPSQGIYVGFDWAAWGGTGADGLALTLFDGSNSAPSIGPNGGGLGAIAQCAWAGFPNTYLIVGVDSYGASSQNNFGCPGSGTGARGNAVSVRTAGNGTSGYAFLTNAALGTSVATLVRPTSTSDSNYRRLHVWLVPGASNYLLTVLVDSGSTRSVVMSNVAVPLPAAATLRLALTAATGGLSQFHEIRNINVGPLVTLSGTVFEDPHYGGGAGRSKATALAAGGSVRSGARVEVFDGTGLFVGTTTTDASGNYSFMVPPNDSYTVRVVSSSVTSARTGYTSGLLPVLTWRTDGSSGSAVAVTDRVGGENPALTDAGNGSTTLSALTTGSTTAQNIATATVVAAGISGLDFGFNFSTVVNTRATGQGSLYQGITNANALGGDASLAQSGRTAGIEHLVFMLSNGTTGSGGSLGLTGGLRSGYNLFTTAAGSANVATIAQTTALPTVTSPLVLDAQTQPGWTSVPLIELRGNGLSGANGLTINAANCIVRGFIVNTFGLDGLNIAGGASQTIQGNYFGLNAAGTASAGNGQSGIAIVGTGNGIVIGGTTAAQRNVIGGVNGHRGIWVGGGTGHVIKGNYLGSDVTGAVALGNTIDGITLASATGNVTIGGVNANEGNLIRANLQRGISIACCSTGNTIRGNSIYGNGAGNASYIGIDLGTDGPTANDGAKGATANGGMDYPVFTAASVSGTTLTVAGYVGSAANQSVFASALVDVYLSDAVNPAGQGKTYLGTLTANASGNFSGSVTLPGGVTLTPGSSSLTGTATDGSGNTSEFGTNYLYTVTISGTVFEDINYGGGAGRSKATALAGGGSGRSGARVELFTVSGSTATYNNAATTDASGNYTFTGVGSGNYVVRVVENSVPSARTLWNSSLKPVLTFRTDASSGTATALTDQVGGTSFSADDATQASAGATFNTSTGVFSVGPVGTAQAYSPVTVGLAAVSGVDFGFNYSTVINTRDTGRGSLRQFITNASTMGGQTGLAQSGSRRTGTDALEALPAGYETSVFMIPGGAVVPGLRSGLASQLTGGVAVITLASVLPVISSSNVAIDGSTQSANIGNANAGYLGSGGTVGTDGVTLAQVPMPEVQLAGNGSSYGVWMNGSNQVVRCLALTRFLYDIYVYNTGSGNLLEFNVMGTSATSFSDPGSSQRSYHGLYWVTSTSGTVRNNLVGWHEYMGLYVSSTSSFTASGNETRGNGQTDASSDGINLSGVSNSSVTANLSYGNAGMGIDIWSASNGNTVTNNTTTGNGMRASEFNGIRVYGDNNTIDRNIVTGNYRSGINIYLGSANRITANQSYANGGVVASISGTAATTGLGIDLANDNTIATNNGTKTVGLANYEMDRPVLTSASLSGTTLTVAGYVGSAAGQATFANSRVEVFIAESSSVNQARKYVGYVTSSASNGNFNATITGVVLTGTAITATATDTLGNTSELSANIQVTGNLTISGTVFEDVNYGGGAGRTKLASGGTGLANARVELYDSYGGFVSATTTAAGGGYSFAALPGAPYYVRVVSSSVLSSRSGATASQVGVLTYRTDASSGTAMGVTDNVGGTNPALVDPGNGSSGTTLNTATGVFTAGLSGTAQALSTVTPGVASVSGVDFGFNFSTVVNVNNSGQGSLRQAISNANALGGDNTLAQAGRTAGIENLVFMIPNGSTGSGGSLGLTGGLRSSINLFSGGMATISPTSVLPTLTTAMVIDGQAQPGWTLNPLIDIDGTSAGAVHGLQVTGPGATLRGLLVRKFGGGYGIYIAGSSPSTVQGCWVGLNTAGTGASANAQGVWVDSSSSNQIGGTSNSQRNVLSGNTYNGLVLSNATGTSVLGNYMGLNANGTGAVANGDSGIVLLGSSTGTLVGGVNAGEGNVIAGNTALSSGFSAGISIQASGSTGSIIRGNTLGMNATRSGTIATSGYGIYVTAANTTVGGTTTAAANLITAHSLDGVAVVGASTNGVLIQGNSIYGNSGIGIDLADNGATANDGAKTASQPNLLMDAPVFTSAVLAGSSLVVNGYVGSAANQATFANARVEIFISDASSSRGSGKTYLGFVTTDSTGAFGGTISGVSGLVAGSGQITGTATDGSNNTSEFGANYTVVNGLAGTVYVDTNYGGGAGRSKGASSGGTVRPSARVELYTVSGSTATYSSATTTDAYGNYSFTGIAAGNYAVRVVASSVTAGRTGYVSGLLPVLTWRSDASSGSAVAVTDNVGGTNPAASDGGNGAAGTVFNTSTGVFSSGTSGTAQAFTLVNAASQSVGGLDFGFNFNTVVNTNDSGAGSLRQAITNANTLGGDASLAQAGRTAAIEHVVFMVPNGSTAAGLRSAYNYFGTSAGSYNVATLSPTSALPSITSPLVIDAQTQPGWALAPLVELRGSSAPSTAAGLMLQADGSAVRGFVIGGWGLSGIQVQASSVVIAGNWIGLQPSGAVARSNGSLVSGEGGIYVITGTGVLIGGSTAAQRNVLSGNAGAGVLTEAAAVATITGNYVGTNAAGDAAIGNGRWGVNLHGGSGHRVGGGTPGEGNVISGNGGYQAGGILIEQGSNIKVQGNTIGLNAARTAAIPNGDGGSSFSSGIDIRTGTGHWIGGAAAGEGNVIAGNNGHGVRVMSQTTRVLGNNIYNNLWLGIDLNADGADANDGAKTAGQPNLRMDAPVFTSASLSGNTLTVAGYVGSAANQATFSGARVEVFISDNSSSRGSGRTYLGALTADASGNFSGGITVSGFSGTTITATATDGSGNTSEFGDNFVVPQGISGTVYEDANYGGGAGRSLADSAGSPVPGARVELYSAAGVYISATTTNATGGYTFTGLATGNYFVRVVASSVASQRSGSTGALRGVLTWRSNASSGSALPVTDEVGGTNPAATDPAAGSAGATFNTSTKVFSAVLSGTAQAVAPVALGTGQSSGVDFGFNFSTVVNTNDSGAGSLRQVITNANALGNDAALAQAGRTAGIEQVVFMISNGSTAGGGSLGLTGGLRSSINYFGTSVGAYSVATIAPTSALPAITSALVIDAQTQPGWTLNPIIELRGDSAGASIEGLQLNASNTVLRGLIINRFSFGGVYSYAGDNLVVQGCWLGLNAAGNAAAGNGTSGLYFASTGSNHVIGGTSAAQRNVVAGSVNYDGLAFLGGSGHRIFGNYIGTNAAGNAVIGNGRWGIVYYSGSNHQIGGTAAGEGNVIVGNGSAGITLGFSTGGVSVLGNSIFGNGGIGIDLNDNGVTANDGAKTAGAANSLMDSPVITQASLSGSNLTVSGYVGSAAGQSLFAGARVEIFVSDNDASGFGEGQTYLGALTTDASGNFSGTLAVPGGVTITIGSTRLTGTATDGSGNTSEFGANFLVPAFSISGTVFDDVNYGGGAGRPKASASGWAAASNGASRATLELYDGAGNLLASTSAAADGSYSFASLGAGSYQVRLVTGSAPSSRSGWSGSLKPVLTYRVDASSGSVAGVTDQVGGLSPNLSDAAANSGSQTLADLTTASAVPQAVAPVTLATANLALVDFGIGFDVVANANDSGAGSLRQAISNANALGNDAALAQAGRTAGIEHIVFMISNGSSGSGGALGLAGGLRSGIDYTSSGLTTLQPATALPSLSTPMVIDARTQPGWARAPVVALAGAAPATAFDGLTVTGSGGGSTIAGLAIGNFQGVGIRISASNGNTVSANRIGVTANGTTAWPNTGNGIQLVGNNNTIGGSGTGAGNVLSGNAGSGLNIGAGSSGNTVAGNLVGLNAAGDAAIGNGLHGVLVWQASSNTIGGTTAGARNVLSGQAAGAGLYIGDTSATGNLVQGNFIGTDASGLSAVPNHWGIDIDASNTTVGGTAAGAGNRIAYNTDLGVAINGTPTANASGNAVLGNAIYANGANPGIDLGFNGITANTGSTSAALPNRGMNAPVFTRASSAAGTLSVTGYIGTAAGQAVFAGARVEVFLSDASTGFGSGQTYLGFVTADASGNFSGTITLPGGVTITNGSSQITGTATSTSNDTSEFGANVLLGLSISGTVFDDRHYGGGAGRPKASASGWTAAGNASSRATLELYDNAGTLLATTQTAADGSYAFDGVAAGSYQVRLVTGSAPSGRSGWTSSLRPVLTYRVDASSGSVVDVTNEVGGRSPALDDAAANSGSQTLASLTSASATPQALAPVTVGTTSVGLVDFGINFDVVSNVNDSGAGSLRQAITNANALGDDAALAQALRPGGVEHIVFMISNGSTGSGGVLGLSGGLRAANNLTTGGVASIALASALPSISSGVVIDAQAQPGWTADPLVELNGTAAGATSNGLVLDASGITVRGFVINRFGAAGVLLQSGNNGVLQGCWIGLSSNGSSASANGGVGLSVAGGVGTGVLIGGTSATQRNVVSGNGGSGLYINGGTGLLLQGNYVGTNASGTAAVANGLRGVWLDAGVATATVGGTAAGAGNVISGQPDYGLWLEGGPTAVMGNRIGTNAAGTAAVANDYGVWTQSDGHLIGGTAAGAGNLVSGNVNRGIWLNSAGNTVQGNRVGTNAAGTAALANGTDGIYVKGINNTVGGSASGAGNQVSGNGGNGILLHALGDGSVVQGNTVGLNAAGTTALPNAVGISVGCASNCRIGGTASGEGNTVSGNTGAGVVVTAGSGHRILRNAISGNGGIGIDLGADGVTPNDGAQTTGQPNLFSDQPVFTAARVRGNQLTVSGYVGTAAGQALFAGSRIDVYTSDVDASGYGEGAVWLGTLTADASGNFSGTVSMPVATLAVGTVLTGTATDTAGNTSEFSAQFNNLVVDFVVNSTADDADANPGDGLCLTAGGVCTLRAAILEVNARAGLSYTPTIAFALPGCTAAGQVACRIAPATALPFVSRAATIDAQTQPGWTLAPMVELLGSSAPSFANGLSLLANGSTVRGLVIGGFGQAGIAVAASTITIEGNYVGLTPDGNSARPNGAAYAASGGVHVVSGTGIVVGGSTPAQRNVLSGNGGAGIWTDGGTVTVIGNYIGTNAAGGAAVSNGRWGVNLYDGNGHRVGGSAAGEGNVISGNVGFETGGVLVERGSNATIQGNRIGLNAAGTAYIPNGDGGSTYSSGIDLRLGSGHLVGGTNAGEGNEIAGNNGHGIRVMGQTTRILGNSIHDNVWLGIDLNADGVTANDGIANASANNGMDHPVITGAGVNASATGMTVYGYIGTGTGQAAFAGARVEFFKAAPDASGYGEGQVYLGSLTADANGRFNGTLTFAANTAVAGDAITATATSSSNNTSEFGPTTTSTTQAGLAPAGFEAFDTDAAAGALSGPIRSRVAGAAAPIAVIALDYTGTALHAGFTGTVSLRWLDARDDSGAASGSCRASWVDLGSAGSAVFANGSRVSVNVTPPATATRSMRLQMSYAGGPSGSVVACSGDAFAALPATVSLAASDADAATAGTSRALSNASASGGVVHRAGRPFTLTAQARDATGALMTGYDGSPTLAATACLLPSGCTAAALGGNAVSASGGVYSNATVTYAEVGAVSLQLTDATYAAVDAADTALPSRTISSAVATVGRFVPDSLTATVSGSGQFATANGACLAAGSGATFLGQGFGWASAPQVTLTARNAAGATTAYWTGSLMKLAAGNATPGLAAASAGSATLATSFGSLALADLGSGQVRFTASASDRFVLDTAASSPQASTSPQFTWQLSVSDASEAGVAGNSTLSASTSQSPVAFDLGNTFHSGRLALASAHGDARMGVRMLVQLQRYTSAGWVTMTEDRGCVTVLPANLGIESPAGVFAGAAGACAAPMTASATTQGGRAWLVLPATPGAALGRLTLRLANTTTGNSCAANTALLPLVAMDLPWLMGGVGAAGPAAPATWGSPNRDAVLRREVW